MRVNVVLAVFGMLALVGCGTESAPSSKGEAKKQSRYLNEQQAEDLGKQLAEYKIAFEQVSSALRRCQKQGAPGAGSAANTCTVEAFKTLEQDVEELRRHLDGIDGGGEKCRESLEATDLRSLEEQISEAADEIKGSSATTAQGKLLEAVPEAGRELDAVVKQCVAPNQRDAIPEEFTG